MMRRSIWIAALALFAAAALSACGGAAENREPVESTVADEVPAVLLDEARRATRAAGSDFVSQLMQELKERGPADALDACAMSAQDMAKAHSMGGAQIRRVSRKVRNPADLPDDYERGILTEWEALHESGDLPQESAAIVVESGRRTLRYLRPIVIIRPCLQCHGDPAGMLPEVNARLQEEYPDDEATGYEEGDLRGALSLTMDLGGAG